MKCPRCDAVNPDGADWCGQCLMRFGTPIPVIPQPKPPERLRQPPRDGPAGGAGADGATSAPPRPPDLGRTMAAAGLGVVLALGLVVTVGLKP